MEDLGSGVITVIRQLIIRECGRKSADSDTATAVRAASAQTDIQGIIVPPRILALEVYNMYVLHQGEMQPIAWTIQ